MRALKIHYNRSYYGQVMTQAQPGANCLRVEAATLMDLAQLVADLLGCDQPDLLPAQRHYMAPWLIAFGQDKWGSVFLRACAQCLIWKK